MSQTVAFAEQLGKRYSIGSDSSNYGSIRDSIVHAIKAAPTYLRRPRDTSHVWALKDVSFEIRDGEAIGIVGRNGAGKSTLLKILARITEPTTGLAGVRGRIGALLEVGTGFHPELTGSENIFLNGVILGMSRADIARRFDDIVEFSGVGQFLGTPVKHFSSGMYMRLAFAVAAHLEPDVLVVDEVLAVGDAEFQQRCLRKMGDVAREGRTVLFVSHNMASVEALCRRVIVLERGGICFDGGTRDGLDVYRGSTESVSHEVDLRSHFRGRLGTKARMSILRLFDDSLSPASAISTGRGIVVELCYELSTEIRSPSFGVLIETMHGARICHLTSDRMGGIEAPVPPIGVARCCIKGLPLAPGRYSITVGMTSGHEQLDLVERAAAFEVVPADVYGTGKLPDTENGVIILPGTWSLVR